MTGIVELYRGQLIVFVLILTRVSGVVMTSPTFGARSAPLRFRALLTAALAGLMTAFYWNHAPPPTDNLVELAGLVIGEAMLGLALGMGVMILFSALQVAGQIIGQMSGMQLADLVDPNFDGSVPVFARLLDLIAVASFLAIGGHRQVTAAMLETFQWMPPGEAVFSVNIVENLVEVTSQSFILGIRASAPVMTALLLSILVMGLISRTLPQLNVIAIGFSFNSLVLLGVLAVSLGGVIWMFDEQAQSIIDTFAHSIMTGQKVTSD